MSKIKDPILVPIALPFLSGPAVLAFIMIKASLPAILLAWGASAAVLFAAIRFKSLINETLLTGIERFSAFILAVMSIEMIISGFKSMGIL